MSIQSELFAQPHRRFNILTHEWVLVSPHRIQRPWLGRSEKLAERKPPAYVVDCTLCPGNQRLGGMHNPHYTGPYIIENAYPPLLADTLPATLNDKDILVACSEHGLCRLMCFSPRHDLSLPEMTLHDLKQVVDTWTAQLDELGSQPFIRYVQIFENKGELMGSGYAHPHCQFWASETIPDEPTKEQRALSEYLAAKGSCLLCDYLALELERKVRIICENTYFVVLVPFWAVWPFETLVLSKRHAACLLDLSEEERVDLADILKRITTRYDNLFDISFPYSFGFHQRPTDWGPDRMSDHGGADHPEWHLHAHFYPPLLRSATIRKYMSGYELLATRTRDLSPEQSAERLCSVSELHYRER